MKGIDVSHYQGKIDWAKVAAAGYSFVMIAVTEGITYVDPNWLENYNGAKAAGLRVGFYHFGHPNDNPVQEAQHFLATVKGVGLGDLPVWYDIEVADGRTKARITDSILQFTNDIKAQTGHDAGWYSNTNFISQFIDYSKVQHLKHWIASWGKKPGMSIYYMWQESDSGTVPGIQGHVDIDETGNGGLLDMTTYPEVKVQLNGHPVASGIGVPKGGTEVTYLSVAVVSSAVPKVPMTDMVTDSGIDYVPYTVLENQLPNFKAEHINGGFNFTWHVSDPVTPAPPTPPPVSPPTTKSHPILAEVLAKIKSPSFVLGVAGAVKLVTSTLGYHLPDTTVNALANGVAGVVTIIAVYMDHGMTKS
jgi:GH25 family lysozyme M1 (1,4-beta-N-acetylmuramidase)